MAPVLHCTLFTEGELEPAITTCSQLASRLNNFVILLLLLLLFLPVFIQVIPLIVNVSFTRERHVT